MQKCIQPNRMEETLIAYWLKNKSKFKISHWILFNLKIRFLKNKTQKDYFDNIENVDALKKQMLILHTPQSALLGLHPLSVCIITSTSAGIYSNTVTALIFTT